MATDHKQAAPTAPLLPCTVEHYSMMLPWPIDGKPGQCWGNKCSAYAQVNDTWGYCLFHQAIRAMANDAKRGNPEVRRVLEKLGVKS
jgi:hypothetical protein